MSSLYSKLHVRHSGTPNRAIQYKIQAGIYALIAYCAFLFSILFAIAFIGNIPVVRTIDSVKGDTTWFAVTVNLLLMSLFALQHSFMARPVFKRWITRFIAPAIERSTFVLLSSMVLLLVFWQWQPMTEVIWQVNASTVFYLINSLYVLGWAIVFASSFMINHFELFGLKQVFEYCTDRPATTAPFAVRYLYTFVRHPLMLGFLIAMWAAPTMTSGHLLFSGVMTFYILIAVKFLEERDLLRSIGKQYEDYQKQVPMIFPTPVNRSSD